MIDLDSISQALAVAEHLSFRRAANVLGVRQSAVSRRIRALEDSLGVSIFERHHGGVRLTAAGKQFLDEARSALVQLETATKVAQIAGRGQSGHLRIGISSSIATGFLRKLIQTFREQHAQVNIEITDIVSQDYTAFVQNGRFDVAFTIGTPVVSGCETSQLWTERLVAVLPQEHPLATIMQLDWQALCDERFILPDCDLGRAIEQYVISFVSETGRVRDIQRFDVGRETALHLVAIGLGVSLTTEATTAGTCPGVAFRRITNTEVVVSFSAVWSRNNDNPVFRRFLSLAQAMAKNWNHNVHDATTLSFALPMARSPIGRISAPFVSNGQKHDPLP